MPSGELTLLQLRDGAKQRADMENNPLVSDPEWNSYVNQSLYELYDLLIQKYGDDYYVAPTASFSTNGNQQLYPLPDGVLSFNDDNGNPFVAAPFYKSIGVDMQVNPPGEQGQWITLHRFNMAERNRRNWPIPQSIFGVLPRYRFTGNQIMTDIFPNGGQVLRLWYIPRMVELVLDTDVADGFSGWLEYVICDAAIKGNQKEETDVSVLMAQKQALIDRIEAAGENRDAGEAQTVSDTRNANSLYENNSNWGWGE